MKKTRMMAMVLALMLMLAMVLTGCGQKKEDELIGTWKLISMTENGEEINPADMGLEVSMTFDKDGTARFVTGIEEDEVGSWKKADNVITVTDPDGNAMGLTLENGQLKSDDNGSIMIFAKDK